jgi:hypothetical protein
LSVETSPHPDLTEVPVLALGMGIARSRVSADLALLAEISVQLETPVLESNLARHIPEDRASMTSILPGEASSQLDMTARGSDLVSQNSMRASRVLAT